MRKNKRTWKISNPDLHQKSVQVESRDSSDPEPNPGYRPYDGLTAYRLYLNEIGQTKLLTSKDEIALAKRIKKGDLKAREEMIKANLRLVVKIARDYEDCGLPLLDLINEGNIGLMTAVNRFDPKKGAKLSTYAAWWIKQYVRRALANQLRTVRLPVHAVDKLFRIRRDTLALQEELGREPTDEEIGKRSGLKSEKVRSLKVAAIRPASLSAPISDTDDNCFGDLIEDESIRSPSEQVVDSETVDTVNRLMKHLEPREQTIVRLRFGLDGGKPAILEKVGKRFGITRERIRQLQNKSLRKMRNVIRASELFGLKI